MEEDDLFEYVIWLISVQSIALHSSHNVLKMSKTFEVECVSVILDLISYCLKDLPLFV